MAKSGTNCVWCRVIIMGIKRLTIEMDDSPDMAKGTEEPESLIVKKHVFPWKPQKTGTPEQQEDYGKIEALEKGQNGAQASEPIGRTNADLAFKYLNYFSPPAVMATVLTVIAFLIFGAKVKTLDDFVLPMGLAIVLIGVSFGTETIYRRWLKKK